MKLTIFIPIFLLSLVGAQQVLEDKLRLVLQASKSNVFAWNKKEAIALVKKHVDFHGTPAQSDKCVLTIGYDHICPEVSQNQFLRMSYHEAEH